MTDHAARLAHAPRPAPAAGALLQRKCACGAHAGGGECRDCARKRGRVQRAARGQGAGFEAPASVQHVLNTTGTPLAPEVRAYMEPRFGRDFSRLGTRTDLAPAAAGRLSVGAANDPLEREADAVADQVLRTPAPADAARRDFGHVRIHTDAQAAASVRALDARAYTVGHHVAFDTGQYAPHTETGRRLLAHELTHTIQQAQAGVALQRFVPCTRARLSAEDCPAREPDEERLAHAEPMILEYITAPEVGYLIANFDVGKGTLKGDLRRHPLWPDMVRTVSAVGNLWEVIGLSDCNGEVSKNQTLRDVRAQAVMAALPPAAVAQVIGTQAAALTDCITDNGNRIARSWNRAALITPVIRSLTIEPEDPIEGKRPVPGPKDQPTVDCSSAQQKAIAQAQPIALDMLRTALLRIHDRNDRDVRQLLRQYFADDSDTTFEHVHDGLLNTRQGLESEIKVECEAKGTLFYDHFCKSGAKVTLGYARSIGTRVHLCEAAFDGTDDLKLAEILIHECSHLYDRTGDKAYCWESGGTACGNLSPKTAYDNADSYANFAHALYLIR